MRKTLTHGFVSGVDLQVMLESADFRQPMAVTAASLVIKERTPKNNYASQDSGVRAALDALIGANVDTISAALNRDSQLTIAWNNALSNSAPAIPGVDPLLAALTLRGWSES